MSSYHNKSTKRTEEVSLKSLRDQRSQDVALEYEFGGQHTAKTIKDSLNEWLKSEGITLAGGQMMRLNEYFLSPQEQQQPNGRTAAWEEQDGGVSGYDTSFGPPAMGSMEVISSAEAEDILDDILPEVHGMETANAHKTE